MIPNVVVVHIEASSVGRSTKLWKQLWKKVWKMRGDWMDAMFTLGNLLVLPFWGLMILAPRWRWTARIIRSPLVSVGPVILYIALVLPRVGEIWPAVSRPTVDGIAVLLGSHVGA